MCPKPLRGATLGSRSTVGSELENIERHRAGAACFGGISLLANSQETIVGKKIQQHSGVHRLYGGRGDKGRQTGEPRKSGLWCRVYKKRRPNLGNLHDHYAKNSSSVSVKGLASAYGAYIGEVIRRSEPGAKWERDDEVGGEKSYPIIWGTGLGHSYPMAWCYRRIVNGPEDNVWVKYSVLRDKYSVSKNKESQSAAPTDK